MEHNFDPDFDPEDKSGGDIKVAAGALLLLGGAALAIIFWIARKLLTGW